jgi:hypothetical protein
MGALACSLGARGRPRSPRSYRASVRARQSCLGLLVASRVSLEREPWNTKAHAEGSDRALKDKDTLLEKHRTRSQRCLEVQRALKCEGWRRASLDIRGLACNSTSLLEARPSHSGIWLATPMRCLPAKSRAVGTSSG